MKRQYSSRTVGGERSYGTFVGDGSGDSLSSRSSSDRDLSTTVGSFSGATGVHLRSHSDDERRIGVDITTLLLYKIESVIGSTFDEV